MAFSPPFIPSEEIPSALDRTRPNTCQSVRVRTRLAGEFHSNNVRQQIKQQRFPRNERMHRRQSRSSKVLSVMSERFFPRIFEANW